ncbi:phosphatase PAP2 family protein [Sinomonas sp. ASV322]|uniref:phosphatase PAP2 family protein n=1 Tax=Sinomonas sp. ASV322 TaxID=3041920 RepID=UPI0027DC1121|nr:phosphatase PAP2 family protein [Sinomonas sp. ASV322]MDQ4502802.1 phosphatase PAP2 family protein [Sinomonas sp. ASV322]
MTSSDFTAPSAPAKTPRSRLATLPSLRHWIIAPVVMSVAVFALGFIATTSGVTSTELSVNQTMSTQHVGWLNTVSLAVEKILGPSGAVVILLVLIVVLWFLRRTPIDALAVASITGFGWVFSLIFKYAVHRHRPDPSLLANPLSPDMDPNSFPSGHVCFAVSLTIALYFLFRHTRWGSWILIGGMVASGLVAISRVYVGVHYPIDVIASFPASVAGILLWCGLWNRFAMPILSRVPFVTRLEYR